MKKYFSYLFLSLILISCETNDVIANLGCTDPIACNYDPTAVCDDGSCDLPSGCGDTQYLEYDSAEVEIHKKDVKKGWNLIIHDDLLATGGTAIAASELISELNANVSAYTFVIELGFLNGSKKLRKYSNNIISLTTY